MATNDKDTRKREVEDIPNSKLGIEIDAPVAYFHDENLFGNNYEGCVIYDKNDADEYIFALQDRIIELQGILKTIRQYT